MKQIGKKRVYDGHIKLDELMIEKDGEAHIYTKMTFKNAACVLAVKDDKLLLINQHRHSLGKRIIEISGGTKEENEPLEKCAKREVEEETGYEICDLKEFERFHPLPGLTGYMDVIFFANVKDKVSQKLDALEDIEPIWMDKKDVLEKILNGEITDAKLIIAFFIAREKGLI